MSDGEFSTPVRVYIEDTDAGGIVYYVNYLKFMERARTEMMRSLGFGKNYIFNHDLMFVVTDVAVHYSRPATLDDQLLATARIQRLRGASMVMQQRVLRGAEVLAAGEISIACVDRGGVKPRRLPADMAARLRALQSA
ncbi:MAG: tol-pal system-associated acyl-CoA thioesterase [Pseudomonadales bacterium]|nr:tol-pal system-associated acyl-CoA thioesterase [Pseudomonadales bacterium]MCP5189145.1 tol-pal system-associated acyl-CoA thioesterase [Pseudomonadales bacterium]MCP5205548.1 tol-pal system-associated acyl-CoA thioesterase [Pseudomonadales bacterium]